MNEVDDTDAYPSVAQQRALIAKQEHLLKTILHIDSLLPPCKEKATKMTKEFSEKDITTDLSMIQIDQMEKQVEDQTKEIASLKSTNDELYNELRSIKDKNKELGIRLEDMVTI
jgi:predicted RNase H-like nuclease (RuvC/YqgF family)